MTINVKIVENARPPMTATASGCKSSLPLPKAKAIGIMPSSAVSVVMTIGRNRRDPA